MSKVVTFGEIMLRLAPNGFLRFVQTDSFTATYGGGEANVAVSLAQWGINSYYVSKIPENSIGQAAVNQLRRFGVNTSFIKRGGERLGIYFLEKGASQRASTVIYDRKDSAISQAEATDFDWEEVFKDCDVFHFTGITPALNDNVASILKESLEIAKKHGCLISCDLNFRKKLWSSNKANTVMSELMKYVDICIANEEDAEKVFGIKAGSTKVDSGHLDILGYESVISQLVKRFGFKKVAITLRGSISASKNTWSAIYYDGFEIYKANEYSIDIVDRVGGGDSFAAGLIYGVLNNMESQKCIDFAVAASCLKHSIEGDFNHVSIEEVNTLLSGDGSGRVNR